MAVKHDVALAGAKTIVLLTSDAIFNFYTKMRFRRYRRTKNHDLDQRPGDSTQCITERRTVEYEMPLTF